MLFVTLWWTLSLKFLNKRIHTRVYECAWRENFCRCFDWFQFVAVTSFHRKCVHSDCCDVTNARSLLLLYRIHIGCDERPLLNTLCLTRKSFWKKKNWKSHPNKNASVRFLPVFTNPYIRWVHTFRFTRQLIVRSAPTHEHNILVLVRLQEPQVVWGSGEQVRCEWRRAGARGASSRRAVVKT